MGHKTTSDEGSFCVLRHIICKNSFPANKVWREYFLRASVSCVTLFKKNLFYCVLPIGDDGSMYEDCSSGKLIIMIINET